jgi:flagellar protein FliS
MIRPSQEYLATHVETAAPGQLVVMLYDGALMALEKARSAAEQDPATRRFEGIIKNVAVARRILTELSMALDLSQGILPQKLFALYSYMSRRLSDALGPQGKSAIGEVAGMLLELQEAWRQACASGPAEQREPVACSVDLSC